MVGVLHIMHLHNLIRLYGLYFIRITLLTLKFVSAVDQFLDGNALFLRCNEINIHGSDSNRPKLIPVKPKSAHPKRVIENVPLCPRQALYFGTKRHLK